MRAAITEKFNPVHMEVDDLGTCGTSYQVIIVSVRIFRQSFSKATSRKSSKARRR